MAQTNLVEKAITDRPFPQQQFMTEQFFARFLKDRGFNIGIGEIEAFVELGIIEKLDTPAGDFHPFQIWPIRNLLRQLDIRLYNGLNYHGLDPDKLKKVFDLNWSFRAKSLLDIKSNWTEFNQQLLPMLLWLESHFLPVIHGPRSGVVHLVNANFYDTDRYEYDWSKWTKHFNFEDLLKEHSLSIDEVATYRFGILLDANREDPDPDLYLLLRSMPIDRRSRFKGSIRLAHDLYEIAEIMRLFLEKVSEQPIVKEWDPTGHPDSPWVERLFDSQPRFGSPEFLRPLIRYYGLDPAFRVKWMVEGQTEEGFILQYAKRLGASIQEFVQIQNFGGDGNFKKRIVAIDAALASYKDEQCFVALTFDESYRARKRVNNLIQDGLISLTFVLNDPDFERHNFSIEQLIEVATLWAADLKKPIKMCPDKLLNEVKAQLAKGTKDFKKAFNDVLRCNCEEYHLSKGVEWGIRLANYLTDKRNSEAEQGKYSEDNLSKVERQIYHVLRASQPFINFPLSIEHLDTDRLEIK